MRKITLIFCLSHYFCGLAFGQGHKGKLEASAVPALNPHYQSEYTFDRTVDTLAWQQQEAGLHVSFGSTDKLYFRSEVPDLETATLSWEGTGWRGERMNAQMLVWSPDTLRQVCFTMNDLVNAEGDVLSKNNMQLNMVRYVLSDYPYGANALHCAAGSRDTAYLMPDRLETLDRFEVPGRTTRPVWLSFDIPEDAKPGVYSGTIEVNTEEYDASLQVKIEVQDQRLPAPGDWKFRLDLWQNPWVVAWYYHLEPWSEEHQSLLKKHLKLYADAGGKYITTYAVHSPWSDNSYRIEGTMIDWIKREDGSWHFDYSIFDQYVSLAMEVGVDEAITIYTLIPWGDRFRYMDEKTGHYVYATWAPTSNDFKEFWHIFLDDLKAHLEDKGWFEKTYLGINENPLDYTLAAAKVIHDHSEEWKITYAGNWHPELDHLLDDYSFLYGEEPSVEEVKARSEKGFTSTYYVCCNPAKPNNFVYSPPIEGRWMGWYTAAYGYDGFLRWAYDAWPEDPVRDARHVLWPAGDCFLVYPGANSSIRFEKLREGIVDYEKIRILRELASASSDKEIRKLMHAFDTYLKTFTEESEFEAAHLEKAVSQGKAMIRELSEQLAR